jgi:hypothetical protein
MSDENVDAPVSIIEALATEFDELCTKRMEFGQEKYGDWTWLAAPTPDMLVEELADMVNYARMFAVKIRLIQLTVQGTLGDPGFTATNPEHQ